MITRTFTFERETKNTYRFKEVVPGGDERNLAIGVLYVKKSAFDTQPIEVTVTVEATK